MSRPPSLVHLAPLGLSAMEESDAELEDEVPKPAIYDYYKSRPRKVIYLYALTRNLFLELKIRLSPIPQAFNPMQPSPTPLSPLKWRNTRINQSSKMSERPVQQKCK